jgi:hypothetical protein
VGVALGTGPGRNHAFVDQLIRQMSVLPSDTMVYRIIRLNCPNLSVPDVYFNNTIAETVFAASSISDDVPGMIFAV